MTRPVPLPGGSPVPLGVRLPVEGDQVVITSVDDSRLTLERRLATYDPKRHGSEQMATTKTLGAERW